ncbi:hypothetical protein CPT_Sansa104 [Caulobacter phage Sansa]|uniref:Uncharacterized protein n=1 Tax=Caulobacter phage Sansa TaxID=1675600 RepID=A0A0K1LMS3_9CAUD|nr:hypothetical protein HOR07_gp104 [Caulobacter phage Sansa]AKU43508.1 hypothetical protein CPT_Sansa104 [Caulobacter phage Sansa]
MLKPVEASTGLAAIAARREAQARAEAREAAAELITRAADLAKDLAALKTLDSVPSGIRQLADRLSREAQGFAKGADAIPWR